MPWRHTLMLAAWGAAVVLGAVPCGAWPRYYHSSAARAAAKRNAAVHRLKNELQAAKEAEAAAESELAQALAWSGDVTAELRRTGESIDNARAAGAASAAEMRQLEASILDRQANDSPFAAARAALQTAREAFLVEEQRVLGSEALLAQLKQVEPDERHAVRTAEIQEAAIQTDRAAALAKSRLLEASETYHQQRFAALSEDSAWMEAAAARRTAKQDLIWTENESAKHGIHGLTAKQAVRAARERVELAQSRVAAIGSQLRRLGVDPDMKAPAKPHRTPKVTSGQRRAAASTLDG